MSLVLAWVLRDFAQPLLEYIPFIDSVGIPSKEWFGTQGVLRVSFGNCLFFSLFALIMTGVEDQKDPRDGWHHGGWMLKFILWGVLIGLSFLPPDSLFGLYGQVARIGSGIFLLVQMIILLDFTYSWNAAWVAKDEQNWYMALLAVSVACFVAIIGGAVFMFLWFNPAGQDCQLNTFFVSFSLILVFGFTTLSLHPEVHGSLLPSSVIGLYCMYLCWSALSSEPSEYECNGLAEHRRSVSAWSLALGCLTTLLSVVYSAVRAGSSTALLSSQPDSPGGIRTPLASGGNGAEDDSDDDLAADTSNGKPVKYVYSFFHIIFALASMYSAMLLTGWGGSGVEGEEAIIDVGWPSVWVKLGSQWVTAALYCWSLLAPLLLPDRDFY